MNKKHVNTFITTILIILLIVIVYYTCYKENFKSSNKQKVDIIFSINAYKNIDFLKEQIKNIEKHTKNLDIVIVLNLSPEMYYIVKNDAFITNKNNVIINPHNFEKKRFHGSILKGIYSNMDLCYKKYHFKYFTVLSCRTIFYRNLSPDGIQKIKPKKGIKYAKLKKNEWFWNDLLNTKLGKYLIKKDLLLENSAHEGLTLDYKTSERIIMFLQKHNDIKYNLFNYDNCVEEFAFQSLAVNFGLFYDIGNGCFNTTIENSRKDKFVRKVDI